MNDARQQWFVAVISSVFAGLLSIGVARYAAGNYIPLPRMAIPAFALLGGLQLLGAAGLAAQRGWGRGATAVLQALGVAVWFGVAIALLQVSFAASSEGTDAALRGVLLCALVAAPSVVSVVYLTKCHREIDWK